MSRDSDASIPSSLRDRLQAEDAEERSDLEATWNLLGAVEPHTDDLLDLDAEWEALQRRRPEVDPASEALSERPSPNGHPSGSGSDAPSASSRTRSERRPVRSDRFQQWGRWVGAFAFLLLVAVASILIWQQPVTVTAAAGQQRTVTLPDGSTVELNSGTTLTYRRGFDDWPLVDADRRRVQLRGEAFFTVEERPRPFVVETVNAHVIVKGTRFNVRARTVADSTTAVTVTEGRVQVRPREHPDRGVILDGPGQSSRVREGRVTATTPRSTEVDPVLVWRQNGFAVTKEPLVRVIHELEQRYDTSIRFHESVTRTNAPVTLYYPNPTPIDTILRALCTALDLNYRPTSRGYELFAGPDG